ncbi:aldehyde dehydrogenase [Shouchella clausii]
MYETLLAVQKEHVFTGATKAVAYRKRQLQKLKTMLQTYEKELLSALRADLNKQEPEAMMVEMAFLHQEIDLALESIDEWVKPMKVKTPTSHTGSKSWVATEPYGSVLIISPWNYPIQLTFAPLIGALAAGNAAVLKPSELTPRTSSIMAAAVRATFPKELVTVVEGDAKTAETLLNLPFDSIFFTGSAAVGKIVLEKAAKHLTPCTLELGGKSPVIVDGEAKLKLAAKRIAWGKFLNAGQTCIAPDYALVDEDVYEPFLEQLKAQTYMLFSDKTKEGTYTQIVNDKHFERLRRYLDSGHIVLGGQISPKARLMSPTILTDVPWDAPIMQEEIFGPILPVFRYKTPAEAIQKVRSLPNPLALYVFSENERVQRLFTEQLSFGGGCINDTLMHAANPYLPFGGKGTSGIGAYHGYESFRTFSHQKSLLKQSTTFDVPFRYKQGKIANTFIRNICK